MAPLWNPNLATELQQDLAQLQSTKPKASLDITRASQWDTSLLDDEILTIMKTQLSKALEHLPASSAVLSNYQPEISAALRAVVWFFTLRLNQPSPGQSLQNLRYRNEWQFDKPHLQGLLGIPCDAPTRIQRSLHGVLSVFGPLAWERLREKALMDHWANSDEADWKYRLWYLTEQLEKLWKLCGVLNTVAFLYNGKYLTLLDRVLGMRLVYARLEAVRAVSFQLVNQQLLFDGFSDVLMCILPLVDWSAFKRAASRMWSALRLLALRAAKWYTSRFQHGDQHDDASKDGQRADRNEDPAVEDANPCPVCETEAPAMPYKLSPCGHQYCYFCLKTSVSRYDNFRCLVCNEEMQSAERV